MTEIFINENEALTCVSAGQGITLSRLTESNRRPTHSNPVILACAAGGGRQILSPSDWDE
ncbi:hypothetical protein [Micromonospora sp. KLBMP9576]|uniref:hypothetical protein n=1 Tax=Micromonospora sp. KLBMP9576 TaxID=3424769 RepID=UPI003D8BDB59